MSITDLLHESQNLLRIRSSYGLQAIGEPNQLPDSLASLSGRGVGRKSFGTFLGGSVFDPLDEEEWFVLLSAANGLDDFPRRNVSARRLASAELPTVRYSGIARLLPPSLLCGSRVFGRGRRMAAVRDRVPSGPGRDGLSVDQSSSSLCDERFSSPAEVAPYVCVSLDRRQVLSDIFSICDSHLGFLRLLLPFNASSTTEQGKEQMSNWHWCLARAYCELRPTVCFAFGRLNLPRRFWSTIRR